MVAKFPENDVAVTTPVTFNPPAVILTSSLKVDIPPTVRPLIISRSVKLDVASVLIPPPTNLFAVTIPVKFPPTPLTSVIVIVGLPLKPAAVPDVF